MLTEEEKEGLTDAYISLLRSTDELNPFTFGGYYPETKKIKEYDCITAVPEINRRVYNRILNGTYRR